VILRALYVRIAGTRGIIGSRIRGAMNAKNAVSRPAEGKKTKKGKLRKVGYIKMHKINDLKEETIDWQVQKNVCTESTINSYHSTSYVNLKNIVQEHFPQVIDKKEVGEILPWVHIAISNAKRQFLAIYNQVNPKYLQSYLDGFCYKFNRRYFGEKLFDRLMITAVTYKNYFRYNGR
jgi:hypothetical protein